MTRISRIAILLSTTALLAAACGDGGQPAADDRDKTTGAASFNRPFTGAEAYPVFVSPETVVGQNRFLVGLLNDEDAPIGSPDIKVHVAFFDLDQSTESPVSETDMDFLWIQKPFRGLYKQDVRFDSAGKWGAEFTISGDGIDETLRAGFDVRPGATTPAIGERAPSSDTPTMDDVKDISKISTDNDPARRFYETSVAEALDANESFALIFATPKFCQTATCGPMLDQVKKVARDFPNETFIHVEPYDLDKVPDLQPVKSTREWGLPSEPWVFVVNDKGKVSAKFAGVLTPSELRTALNKL